MGRIRAYELCEQCWSQEGLMLTNGGRRRGKLLRLSCMPGPRREFRHLLCPNSRQTKNLNGSRAVKQATIVLHSVRCVINFCSQRDPPHRL